MPLGDVLANRNVNFTGVSVECFVAIAVIDDDVQTVPTVIKGGIDNSATSGGVNRIAGMAGDIDAGMVLTAEILIDSVVSCWPNKFCRARWSGCRRCALGVTAVHLCQE